jgi:hypothetical protein
MYTEYQLSVAWNVPKKLIATRKICLLDMDLVIMLPPESIVRNTRMADIK